MSTTKVEYTVATKVAKEALQLIGLVRELGVEQFGVRLHCDSQGVVYLQTIKCILLRLNILI
jgi:hypothetical protein